MHYSLFLFISVLLSVVAVLVKLPPDYHALGIPFITLGLSLFFFALYALGIKRSVGKGQELVTTGIYRVVRHPQYLGLLLFLLGVFLLTLRLETLVLLVLWALTLGIVAWYEEKELLEVFGDQYRDYMEKVPSIIPLRLRLFRAGRPEGKGDRKGRKARKRA